MKKNFFKKLLVLFVFLFVASIAVQLKSAEQAIETWQPDFVYLKGDTVEWKTSYWEAKWWTKGDEPGTQGEWGVWKQISKPVNLEIKTAEWEARVAPDGFGFVDLKIAGSTSADVVTVETHGDGLISEVELKLDPNKNFNEVVNIKFTHAPNNTPFVTSTIVRAKKGDIVVSEELISPTLAYPVGGIETAKLTILTQPAYGQWSSFADVEIDGIHYSLPCSVVLPKGKHVIYVIEKWWVRWYWGDIDPVMPSAINPRTIDLQGDTTLTIVEQ